MSLRGMDGDFLNLKVLPTRLGLSTVELGGMHLMKHQVEVRSADSRLVFVDAPTASGKTLSMLLRVLETNQDAALVYPTNELINDQAEQLREFLTRIGLRVRVFPDSRPDGLKHHEEDIDLALILANATHLKAMAREQGVSTKGRALDRLFLKFPKRLLLLTNPDTLFMLCTARYARSRYLLSQHLSRFHLLAVDEFHLYNGIALANLLFCLWMLRDLFQQVLIASATANRDLLRTLQSIFGTAHRVTPSPECSNGRIVRHGVRLRVTHSPKVLGWNDGDLTRIHGQVMKLYRSFRRSRAHVKVLVLLNSVVFAEQVYRELLKNLKEQEVCVVHGFVPEKRRHPYRPVTVGTSALELGVDFDAASILFEARDATSFVQRLGRVSRHREGSALAVVPTDRWESLRDETGKRDSVTNMELQMIVTNSLAVLPAYCDFLQSSQCFKLFASFVHRLMSGLGERDWQKYAHYLHDSWLRPSFLSAESEIPSLPVIESLARSGFRGDIISLPAFWSAYDSDGQVSLFDLCKLKFRYFKPSDEGSSNLSAFPKDQSVGYVLIEDIVPHRPVVEVLLDSSWWSCRFSLLKYGDASNFSVKAQDSELEHQLGRVLDGRLAHLIPKRLDWRFPSLPASLPGSKSRQNIVIGPAALLSKFIVEKEAAWSGKQ